MPVRHIAIADVIGMLPNKFYESLHNTGTQRDTAIKKKIAALIPDIERRALVFPKVTSGGKADRGIQIKFFWLEPPAAVPCIQKLCLESDWSLWAQCRTCSRNKFLAVDIYGTPHAACYFCLPPSQHRVVGAKQAEKSLIHEALKNYL